MGNPSTVAHIRKEIRTKIIDKNQNLTFIEKYFDEIKKFRENNPHSQKILPLKLSDVKEKSLAACYIKAYGLEKMYNRWVPIKGREFHSKFRKQISNHNTALISFVNHKKKDVIDDSHCSFVEHDGVRYEFLDEAFEEIQNVVLNIPDRS
ncbi:uncharacterized protein [Chironomus tepperi]|uniref:uncharacterized protein n=1 Tax=Chironomus tepperi TaxID=113505 RepID=UPI00391FB355